MKNQALFSSFANKRRMNIAMSYQATTWAASQRTGNPTLKAILMVIANRASVGEWLAWPKLETIAREADVSKRTVQRALEKLRAMGLIAIAPRYREDGGQIQSDIRLLRDGQPIALDVVDDAPPVSPATTPRGRQVTTLEESIEPSIEQKKERTPAFAVARSKPIDDRADQVRSKPADDEVVDRTPRSTDDEADLIFDEQFWPAYPRRTGEQNEAEARKRFRKIVRSGEDVDKIVIAAAKLAEHWAPTLERKPDDGKFIPTAAKWLKRRGYEGAPPASAARPVTMFDLCRGLEQRVRDHEQAEQAYHLDHQHEHA